MTDEFSTAYSRIRQYVFTRIAAAAPEESSLCLTTERELCELFAASRGTVRRALQMLVDEGLLVRRPHHGTFIHPAVLNSAGQQKLIGLIILNGATSSRCCTVWPKASPEPRTRSATSTSWGTRRRPSG